MKPEQDVTFADETNILGKIFKVWCYIDQRYPWENNHWETYLVTAGIKYHDAYSLEEKTVIISSSPELSETLERLLQAPIML